MPGASLWLVSPAVKGTPRCSPGPPWAHPNCATGGNEAQPLHRGLKAELALPRGRCDPQPFWTLRPLTGNQSHRPLPYVLAPNGRARGATSVTPPGSCRKGFTSGGCLCASRNPCVSSGPHRATLPCSSNYSTRAVDKRGLLISGSESGKRSLPAAAAGRYSALAWSLGWWIVWRQTRGSLNALICSLWIQELARRSWVFSLTCDLLSTRQHLYH